MLYASMQEITRANQRCWCPASIKGEIQDICSMCTNRECYHSECVLRTLLQEVDPHAKKARSCNSPHVVIKIHNTLVCLMK